MGARATKTSKPAGQPVLATVVPAAGIVLVCLLGAAIWSGVFGAIAFGALAGLVPALSARRGAQALFVAGIGAGLGMALLVVLSVGATPDLGLLATTVLPAELTALLVAVAASQEAVAARVSARWVALACVGLIVAASWAWTLQVATSSASTSATSTLSGPVSITPSSPDEDLFVDFVNGVAIGRGYYPTARDVLVAANKTRPVSVDTASPLSYRLPTLYVLLGSLRSPLLMACCGMLVVSLGVFGAFFLTAEFVRPELSLPACAAIAAAGPSVFGTVYLVQTEQWAGMLVLVSLALALYRPKSVGAAWWLSALGASAALLALALRELAAPMVLLGLAMSLINPNLRRARLWIPWAIALAACAGVMGLHVWAVQPYLVKAPAPAGRRGSDFSPNLLRVPAMLYYLRHSFGTFEWLAWLVYVGGIAGALVVRVGSARRLLIVAVVVGGPLLAIVLGPPGYDPRGLPLAYWSGIVLPSVVAAFPLALSRWKVAQAPA